MARFLLRRVGLALVTLLLLSMIIFLMSNLLPGAVAELNHQWGVARPLVVQYLSWLGGALHLDFGDSLSFREPVSGLLGRALVNSLKLGAVAFVIVVPLGILGCIVACLNRDRFLDRFISVTGLSGVAMPEFVTGIVLILLFGITLRIFPISATAPAGSGPLTQIYYLIMPALPLVFVLFGYIARITRAGMNEALDADYTRTAYLKGLSRGVVIRRHVLPNALLPPTAVVATQTGYLIGGLVVIEFIFNYQGIGQLTFTAAQQKDFPLLQAGVLVLGIVYLTATLIADV